MAEKVVEFSSAVRGYHHYRKYWQPKLEEHLSCRHEENNPFDYFAISVCDKNTGAIVGHLPIEISRPTKFLLDRGAMILATLTSTNYCVSPLVQGGLEIPSRVEVLLASTEAIFDIYKDMVDVSYHEREKNFTIIASFLSTSEQTAKEKGYCAF